MIKRLFFVLALCAGPALAQSFPDSFVTTGIASDDTLNIRTEPSASAPIIGEYGPYTLNIEVLRLTPDGNWGLVGSGEGNGWVSMRYLALSNHNGADSFPRPLYCSGTEPFWNLNITVRGDEYQELGMDRRDLEMIQSANAGNGAMAIFQEGPTLIRTLITKKGYCSDGMSDREFGWQATLFNEAPDGNSVQTGCCTLDTNF